jgi:hypothetical protein
MLDMNWLDEYATSGEKYEVAVGGLFRGEW